MFPFDSWTFLSLGMVLAICPGHNSLEGILGRRLCLGGTQELGRNEPLHPLQRQVRELSTPIDCNRIAFKDMFAAFRQYKGDCADRNCVCARPEGTLNSSFGLEACRT